MSATTTTTEESTTQRRSSSDVLQQYGGDAIRMADRVAELERENYRYREQKRDLAAEVQALKGKQVPDGAVVLTGDDAQAWQAFSTLGKPDEVKTRLEERDSLAAEVAGVKRDQTLREVAEAAGYKFAVLRQLGGDREYELRDVTADGQTRKVPFVKDGDTAKPLAEFAQGAWADFLPALQAGDTGRQGGQPGTGQVIPRQQGSRQGGAPTEAERLAAARVEQERSGRYTPF